MIRRRFIASTSLLAGGFCAAGLSSLLIGKTMASSAGVTGLEMGVQIFTFRSLLEENPVMALKLVSEIGYKEIEFSGLGNSPFIPDPFYGMSPREFKSVLDDYGLTVPSSIFSGLIKDIPKAAEMAKILGSEYLILGIPDEFFTVGENGLKMLPVTGIDQFKNIADTLNKMGEKCKELGLRFAFHNHDMEFLPIDNEMPFDVLVRETHPGLVNMELDTGWVKAAGQEPSLYLEKYGDRISHCHLKDYDPAVTAEHPVLGSHPIMKMVAPGKGINDFEKIFHAIGRSSIEHAYIECDMPGDTEQVLRDGYSYISKFLG